MPSAPPQSASDIQPPSYWRRLPRWVQYGLLLMRADRPIGWWLLLLPGWVALPQAARLYAPHDYGGLGVAMLGFWLGAVVTRGAGCVINDLWDRDIDRKIARTRGRPLASGAVSVGFALLVLAGLAVVGLAVLSVLPTAAGLVALAAVPLVVVYPLAKRVMAMPQLILAATFSWAALAGWAVFAGLPFGVFGGAGGEWLAGVCLYAGFAAWVFGYDTIYAIQDKADDRKLGIGSSALALGQRVKLGVGLAYCLALALWGVASVFMTAGWGFYIALGLAAVHLGWQVARIAGDDPRLAGDLFRSNRNLGLLLVVGSVADYGLAAFAFTSTSAA